MGLLLRPDEIASIRAAVATTFGTTCTITRRSSAVWVAQSTVQGDVAPAKRTVTYPGLPHLLALQGWTLTLPWDADVRVGDRVGTAFGTYGVERVEQPTTDEFNFSSVAHGVQVYGADGTTPVFFQPNVSGGLTISRYTENVSTKQSTRGVVATGVPALVDEVSTELALRGVAPEFDLSLICDGATDLRDGDQLTGYTPSGSARTATIQVQHVARHQFAGLDYITATVRVDR